MNRLFTLSQSLKHVFDCMVFIRKFHGMLLSRIRVVFNECKDKDQLVGTRTLESLFQGRLGVPVYHQKNARLDYSAVGFRLTFL